METKIDQAYIARVLGLSKTTVSYVLSGQARERRVAEQTARRILALASEAGYVPNAIARSLRTRRTGTIGVVVVGFEADHTQRLYLGLERVLDPAGFTPIFAVRRWDPEKERRELQFLLERQVDGIIIAIPLLENREFYQQLLARVPLLFYADTLEEAPWAHYVAWDSGAAAYEATRHLIECGRRRIGFIRSDYQTFMTHRRECGYREALAGAGLTVREDWIFNQSVADAAGVAALEAWIEARFATAGEVPDAFYLINDNTAPGVIRALARAGRRVPHDVALVGMGNLPVALPGGLGLTSMASPLEAMGERAGQAILSLIAQPPATALHEIVTHNELIRRETT